MIPPPRSPALDRVEDSFPKPTWFLSKAEGSEFAIWVHERLEQVGPLELPRIIQEILDAAAAKLRASSVRLLTLDAAGEAIETATTSSSGRLRSNRLNRRSSHSDRRSNRSDRRSSHSDRRQDVEWALGALADRPWLQAQLDNQNGFTGHLSELPLGPEATGMANASVASLAVIPLLHHGASVGLLLATTEKLIEWPHNTRWLLQLVASAIAPVVTSAPREIDDATAMLTGLGALESYMVAVFDVESKEGLYLGPTLANLIGLTEGAWRGSTLSILEYICHDDYQVLDRAARSLYSREATYTLAREFAPPINLTLHLRDTNGTLKVCQASFNLLAGTKRRLVAFTGVISPEATETRSDPYLADGASVLPNLIDNANIFVALVNPRRNPGGLYVSAAHERWSGRSRESFLAGDDGLFSELHPNSLEGADARPLLIELLDGVEAGTVSPTETFHRQEITTFNAETSERNIMLELFPVLHGGEWVVGIVGTDNTDAQRMKLERDRALEAATDALETRDKFLARLSHEIVTPMNSIMGHINLVRRSALNPEQDLQLQRAQHAANRLIGLVGNVLELGAIRTDEPPTLGPVCLYETLEEVTAMLSPVAGNAGVYFTIELTALGGDNLVLATPGPLFQVFTNLLSNAIKFSPRHGSVEIRAWRDDSATKVSTKLGTEMIVIEVRDQGPGIDRSLHNRLFQPFERLGADSLGIAGSGLGLVVARELVESIGGTIGLDENVTDGAAFQVRLQRCNPASVPIADAPEAAVPCTERDQIDILYIEDDPSSREIMTEILALDGRFILHCAETLTRGIELAHSKEWALILTDLNLPDAFGPEVVTILRELKSLATTPIIVTSADRRLGTMDVARRAGAAEFWPKPLEFTTLPASLMRIVIASEENRHTHSSQVE